MKRISTAVYLMAALLPFAERAEAQPAPAYSAGSVVNAASYAAGMLAPYTYASVFGTNLSPFEASVSQTELAGGRLPTRLAGVRVLVNGLSAALTYVSPLQINFLVPSDNRSGDAALQVTSGQVAGPEVVLRLHDTAPGLFLLDAGTTVASHWPSYAVVTRDAPASPGEIVILWATGLGPTVPDFEYGSLPLSAAPLKYLSDFAVYLDGVPVAPERILYAGIAPGFPGLYQINLKVPSEAGPDPEVQLAIRGEVSPQGVRLALRRAVPAESAQHDSPGVR